MLRSSLKLRRGGVKGGSDHSSDKLELVAEMMMHHS